MTADEARLEVSHVGEDLLQLAAPAGVALREDPSLSEASGEDWSFSYAAGSTSEDFAGTLAVTGRVLGRRTSIDGEEWDVFDGEVEHSSLWVDATPSQLPYSRHLSTGMFEVTAQDGRWFRIHRIVFGTFGNGGVCQRADVEGSDGLVVDDDFDGCPPL